MNIDTVALSTHEAGFLAQDAFVERLHLEQKRTERSRRPFVLVLLDSPDLFRAEEKQSARNHIMQTLAASTRETDVRGWYETGMTLGVIFTEIGTDEARPTGSVLLEKIRGFLAASLTEIEMEGIRLSLYVFPEDWDKAGDHRSKVSALYLHQEKTKTASQFVKRCIDIAGSGAALVAGAPVFLVIAAWVKFTSKGPVLFRQVRVGQYGSRFTFLKFRSMYVNNNSAIHQDYVKQLIAGSVSSEKQNGNGNVFKITADPRVTPVGKFLRKTSLDELPQFINVLLGEMSLVGPRPPIPYEVECYDLWHRRRLLAVKPGITGLWQVAGRSRTTFDEMVRLDLRYARSWSVWMDLKILARTPKAVLMGDGAY